MIYECQFTCGNCGAVSVARPTDEEAATAARVRNWGIVPGHPDYTRCPDCLHVKREKPPAVLEGQLGLFDA